ncbi:general transcriptional corepressor trfA-like isoform X2 [Panonychus citri]|uniref:general transcriptional corepressor trfA-like isoform X2 n=1 Tax=Panonychus citri TaxID=50023 RepID=UPI002307E223|nr:general transcriptional corepressor trfA-like isoform X2 [Panonychus citri]
MKTEPSAPVKVKLEKNDTCYSSSANTHHSVKQETKVNFNLDIKPNSIKSYHENLELGGTSASKVTRTRKVRRKAGGRKVSTKRKSTYKRKTKGRRRRRTTATTTTTTRKTTRRKRTTKKLVTGKALTPRARICKKLGIERNLSLGIHSLPTIRKMTQENTINHKRSAAGIGVLSLFGSELNSHGSVPLRDDGPDIDTDLSGVDDRSPLPDEQEDSYGPQLPPEDIPLEIDNVDNSSNHNKDTKINNLTTNNDNNDIITTDNNNIESTYNNENHDELPVIDIKPPVQVNESIVADQTITPSEEIKLPSTAEERETTDPDGESKAKLKRCKHGKIIHAKKHDNNSSSKSKRSSSKDNKKEDHKSSLLRTIKKEPRDRDEETPKDSRENRGSRSSLPNRHDVDNNRRLIPHDERTSKHRENDRNRENHLREDRTHSDKRKRLSASKEILSPSSTLPISTTTTTTTTNATLLSHLPLPPLTSSTIRSRSDDNSSKRRSSSSHRRDSSRNNRSPTRKESRKTSPHHDPIENKTSDIRKKSDPEEDDKSKGKKKKRKHKHKHSKYSDEDDYRETKSAKHYDPIESSNGKRISTNLTSDKIATSSTNNSRHQDHHHKKSSSKHRHHSRDGRSSPLSSSHKTTTSPNHREERDEKSRISRSRTKRARHSSPSDHDHISNRNRDDRRESIQTKSGKVLSSVNPTTNEVNTKEIKVKIEDAKDYKDHKEHGIPTNLIGTNTNNTNNVNNVNNSNSKVSRSPTEIKSVLSKPGSPPKKDVRLVSKSRTEFDIFWDENSQNKKVDSSLVDFDPTIDKSGKEETGLRFLPRTLLSDQTSPNVHLPPTVGPRTPPDDERAEKNVILSSPDQTMPTPIQDESLEGDYSNGTPTKQQGSIKSLNSPSIDPDIYDPEAPLDSPEDDQLIKSEIARSQAKLNEMEKKLSPSEKQISAVETVPRPETPELPSPRSPHTNNNNTPTTTNQHKFKSPIIPPLSSSTTSTCRAPTLAESSLPPAPGSLLAQIQKTLNLQTKTHSSHSDSSKQSHPSHSGSTGILSSSTSSSLQSSTFLHASGSSGNDQTNKSSSSTATLAPNINSLSPSLKSLLENLIKAAEQQQSKTKSSKMVSSSNVNNIFKKPAPVLDSKSRSVSHSHHHSVKTKVIDKEPTKKVTSSVNQGPTPIGSAPQGPGMKITDVAVLDDVPSSAVELQVKEKYLKKLNRQERVVEEVKMVLKPFYQRKEITKDEYKEIMRKAVPKICHSKSGEINPQKVRLLVEGYCQRYKHDRKKSKTVKGK